MFLQVLHSCTVWIACLLLKPQHHTVLLVCETYSTCSINYQALFRPLIVCTCKHGGHGCCYSFRMHTYRLNHADCLHDLHDSQCVPLRQSVTTRLTSKNPRGISATAHQVNSPHREAQESTACPLVECCMELQRLCPSNRCEICEMAYSILIHYSIMGYYN